MPLIINPPPMAVEELREQLDYNSETGQFRWKVKKAGRAKSGIPVGRLNNAGYVRFCISGKNYQAHRLAWYLFHGVWAPSDIDHKNGIKSDNRIENLRLATRTENCFNKAGRGSASGFRCVYRDKTRWSAEIKLNNQKLWLGNFTTPEEAYAAVCRAIYNTRGEFARVD